METGEGASMGEGDGETLVVEMGRLLTLSASVVLLSFLSLLLLLLKAVVFTPAGEKGLSSCVPSSSLAATHWPHWGLGPLLPLLLSLVGLLVLVCWLLD